MSVEYRPPEQPATTAIDPDEYTRNPRSAIANDPHAGHGPHRKSSSLSIRSSPNTRHPLPARIERVHLRARIAALERELTIRDRQRRELITQYERELEAQQDHDWGQKQDQKQRHRCEEDDRSGRSDQSDFTQARQSRQTRTERTGLLQRVLDRWHQHRHSK
ncbi:hypothetical protein [Natrialba aegyptia]|uniref:Uncharacterized protein n=1 Tax=Natrialba aegyptia DSM 13077 TaxID=1227491 RepID=M0B7U6_9EURY|nr:hypothetical protein [Natrialba aegyptia]ELZ06562.1 hypothetical protein C480_09495 [Natrialba aegyptia DSM 13077]